MDVQATGTRGLCSSVSFGRDSASQCRLYFVVDVFEMPQLTSAQLLATANISSDYELRESGFALADLWPC